MISKLITFVFLTLTLCSFCGVDFISINRHLWRCPKRPEAQKQRTECSDSSVDQTLSENHINNNPSNTEQIKCACGKSCKGLRGLKSHQRSCRTIKTLCNDMLEDLETTDQHEEATIPPEITEESPQFKPGVKLPQTSSDWEIANSYFHAHLPLGQLKNGNLNVLATQFNDTIYNYFKENFGTVKDHRESEKQLREKYANYSKGQLKKGLKSLKCQDLSSSEEISFVAKLLRSKLKENKPDGAYTQKTYCIDHDLEIKKNFWGYVKSYIEKPRRILPTFTKAVCTEYFKKVFRCVNPSKVFTIPSWIPRFHTPSHEFDMKAPTYAEITKSIKRMKSRASPCPLDQVSIICFKHCPYLRTYLTEICEKIWVTGQIPSPWKRAITILIYKKDSTEDPANFRPITLESVPLKIFTSALRNKISDFLRNNKYIESHIQKGFVHGMSGTFEHTSHLSYIINDARLKQRSLHVTLLDLKNAFGEVNHNLLDCVFEYHHIPNDVRMLIRNLYSGFGTSIATESFSTDFLVIGRGVLQGDCLSPLAFNMVMNTFIQFIKNEKYQQFGYKFLNFLTPRHWYQFADDAAVVTGFEGENQTLLNAFSRWCTWAEMIVRVDKCHAFGMKKSKTLSKQYKPKLYISNKLIPPVEIGSAFTYLGRHFDHSMSDQKHMEKLIKTVDDILETIDSLPIHPRNKLIIYHRYLLSKISWDLTIGNVNITWIKQTLDSKVHGYVRKWLEIPICGTLDIVALTKSKCGLGFIAVSTRFAQCQTTIRTCLRNSQNSDIRKIYETTHNQNNIQYDEFNSTREVIKDIRKRKENRVTNELTTQSLVVKSIWEHSLETSASLWAKVITQFPRNIYNFSIRYVNNSLPNNSNLHTWGVSPSALCIACNKPQTLGHVIGGCQIHLKEKRYNYRHDSILLNIVKSISQSDKRRIYADVKGYVSPSVITGEDYRPDIIIVDDKDLYVLELTVGFETNMGLNAMYKQKRYETILDLLKINYVNVKFINLSMGAIGIYGKSCSNFKGMFLGLGMNDNEANYMLRKVVNICVRTTYYIFCRRNKSWEDPELLEW